MAKLKYQYDNESEIPEAHRDLYHEVNGKQVLAEVDGISPSGRIEEFRSTNTRIMRENDELKKRLEPLEHVDIAKWEELRQKEADLRDEKLFKKDKIDEIVQNRTTTLRQDYDQKLNKAQEELKKTNARLAELTIDRAAVDISTKRKVRPEGIQFVVDRVRSAARMENGIPVIYKNNGEKDYGKSAENNGLKTIEELVDEIIATAPFLLEGSAGGGTGPGASGRPQGGSGNHKGPNPWVKGEHHNLTRQMEIAKRDPLTAKRLRDEAGIVR